MKKHFSSILSAYFGKFASKEFAKPIQNIINTAYVKLLGLDMSNFKEPSSYKSLKELFIRKLEKEPTIDSRIDSVIAPCDSRIIAFGTIKEHQAYQIKGMEYNTKLLLGYEYEEKASLLEEGAFCNFYLSPKDYHRYHMPFDVKVKSLLYIPGKLYPVNMPFLKNKKNLYIENERVVIEVEDRFNHLHFIVLVGALNVGKMHILFEKRVHTNAHMGRAFYEYKEPIELKKGELFGWFEMGSTIVMLSQKNALEYHVELNKHIHFGDIIGELHDN
jgi:phosphatidylserine decarboxylase